MEFSLFNSAKFKYLEQVNWLRIYWFLSGVRILPCDSKSSFNLMETLKCITRMSCLTKVTQFWNACM